VRIRLIAVGTRMPAWVKEGYSDYAARMPRECRLELTEIPVAERGKNADIARLKQTEGAKILKALGADDVAIALDERGEVLDTRQWSQSLKRWMQDGRDVALLIGGPDGHAPDVLSRANRTWSLSKLTLPHALVRVLVAEQLYRAWSLLANHPYHRA
jgi:23S rRNA (pseudouridine1915-N3)-methyltransferase